MPVGFLSEDQARRYGQFPPTLTLEDIAGAFWLAPDDHTNVRRARSPAAQLGFAVQLGTVRFLGTFLARVEETPSEVVAHVATQLDVDPSEWLAYVVSRARLVHQLDIRRRYGYLGFGESPRHAGFLRFLWERAWTGDDRPGELLDHSTRWLVEHRVLLPGATTLARRVAQARERARRRAWRQVNRQLSRTQRVRLERLLEVDAKTRVSELEELRRPPRAPTIDGLVRALDRLERLVRLGGSRLDLAGLPSARQQELAADATGSWAQTIATPGRRAPAGDAGGVRLPCSGHGLRRRDRRRVGGDRRPDQPGRAHGATRPGPHPGRAG